MYNSGVSLRALITELTAETNVAQKMPPAAYVGWVNSLEQLLYSEVIKEMGLRTLTQASPIDLAELSAPVNGQDIMRFEDICAVYAHAPSDSGSIFNGNGTQLTLTTPTSARAFDNVYFNVDGKLYYKTNVGTKLSITYFVRPQPKVLADNDSDNAKIMLPCEFMDMAKARLRSEAYKFMNEDGLAAKWTNDYNGLLETFKRWVSDRRPGFGV